jgi:hypothetical protein
MEPGFFLTYFGTVLFNDFLLVEKKLERHRSNVYGFFSLPFSSFGASALQKKPARKNQKHTHLS